MAERVVVGIAGGSASGKSTLAAALAETLRRRGDSRVLVLSSDRYMRKGAADGPTFFSASAGEPMFDANHPEAIDWNQVIQAIRELREQPDGPTIILVEGHLLFHHPEVRACLDLRVFVELDADERALRRMLRDMQGARANRDPVFIANYYRESARVGHARYIEPTRVHADLIVRGDAQWARVTPMLAAVIEDHLAQPEGASG